METASRPAGASNDRSRNPEFETTWRAGTSFAEWERRQRLTADPTRAKRYWPGRQTSNVLDSKTKQPDRAAPALLNWRNQTRNAKSRMPSLTTMTHTQRQR